MNHTKLTPRQLKQLAKDALAESGVSQTEMAERLGVSQPSVSRAVNPDDLTEYGGQAACRHAVAIVRALTPFDVGGPTYALSGQNGALTPEEERALAIA